MVGYVVVEWYKVHTDLVQFPAKSCVIKSAVSLSFIRFVSRQLRSHLFSCFLALHVLFLGHRKLAIDHRIATCFPG